MDEILFNSIIDNLIQKGVTDDDVKNIKSNFELYYLYDSTFIIEQGFRLQEHINNINSNIDITDYIDDANIKRVLNEMIRISRLNNIIR